MPRRLVDQGEVVAVVFHFRSLDRRVSQLREDATDLDRRQGYRVEPTPPQWRRRPGEVQGLRLQAWCPRRALDVTLTVIRRAADALDELVDHLAHLAPAISVGDLAEATAEGGELAIAPAEVPRPDRVECADIRGGRDSSQGVRRNAVQVGGHALVRAPRATSTSCWNDAESLTAMSASILRFTSTPASLRPCMNCL